MSHDPMLTPRHLDTSTPLRAPAHWPLWLLIVLFALLAARFAPTRAEGQGPIAAVGACAGDLNGDRAVDDADVAALLANFGAVTDVPMGLFTRGDLNDDGRINAADLPMLLTTYGCREWIPSAVLMGPPPDAIEPELEPWMPGMFTTEDAEGRGGQP